MSCFRIVYQRYLEIPNGRNWVIDLVFKYAFVLIKVITSRNDINPYKQLNNLNELFNEYKLENYGFNPFVLTEIISIRDCYDSIFCFSLADCKQKMKSIRFGKDIYSYMANIIDENKVRELDSVSVARCFYFLVTETVFHEKVGQPPCFCFRCRLKQFAQRHFSRKERTKDVICSNCK